MPRALAMAQRTLDGAAIADFYDMARMRRAYFEAAGCRYWAFEQPPPARPGTFLEFVEAPDANTLAAALSASGAPFEGPIYSAVETR